MDSKELRLGNLFQDKYTKQVIEVMELSKEKILFSGNFKGKWQAEPIPLTEEWLLKFGYEDLIDMAISFCKQSEYYGVEITSEDLRKIKVHEAQNLYYALTKKELTIKK